MPDANNEYSRLTAPLLIFRPVAEQLVRNMLSAGEVRFHSVTSRVKEEQSVSRKLQGTKPSRKLDSITDLLGLRIITYFRDDVERAAKIIEDEFTIDSENSVDKRAILDPDRFGYLSVHYIVKLDTKRASLMEYQAYADIFFEIQIRSILQHAWAEIEHDLGYKSAAAVPRDIRRSFSRLAGLLEIADDEFVQIRTDLEKKETAIKAEIRSGEQDIEIDQTSLIVFVTTNQKYLALIKHFGSLLNKPIKPADPSDIGDVLKYVVQAGFDNIGQLVDFLESEYDLLNKFAELWINDDYPGATHEEPPEDGIVDHSIGLFYLSVLKIARAIANGGSTPMFLRNLSTEVSSAYNEAVRRVASSSRGIALRPFRCGVVIRLFGHAAGTCPRRSGCCSPCDLAISTCVRDRLPDLGLDR